MYHTELSFPSAILTSLMVITIIFVIAILFYQHPAAAQIAPVYDPIISLTTDKQDYFDDGRYCWNCTVTVHGNVSQDLFDSMQRTKLPIMIYVYNPANATYRADFVNLDTISSVNRTFTYNVKIDGMLALNGQYRVLAYYYGVPLYSTSFTYKSNNIESLKSQVYEYRPDTSGLTDKELRQNIQNASDRLLELTRNKALYERIPWTVIASGSAEPLLGILISDTKATEPIEHYGKMLVELLGKGIPIEVRFGHVTLTTAEASLAER